MFAGISWGQFGLFLLIGAILYYAAVILLYYRSELISKFSRQSNPADLVPKTAAVPVYSAVGGTADYGNQLSNPIIPPVNVIPGINALAINPSTDLAPGDGQDQDSNKNNENPVMDADGADSEADEPGEMFVNRSGLVEIQETGDGMDEDFFPEDEINLEEQFISFSSEQSDYVEGGISLDGLERTVTLLTQEDITTGEQEQLKEGLEILNDSLLLQTVMDNNSRARSRVDLLLGNALQKIENEDKPAIADSFGDLDVDKLINSFK